MIRAFILFFCLNAFCSNVRGQTIILESVKANSIIETLGEIKFSANKIELKNSTLKCKTLRFESTVNNLIIDGSVKITCTNIIVDKSSNIIKIEGSGTFIIEYSESFEESVRDFSISEAKKIKIYFIKI